MASKVFDDKFVTWTGESKRGDGKVFYLKDVEGIFSLGDQEGDLNKGDTVKVKASGSDKGWTVERIKVTEKAKPGGSGGSRGGRSGGGGWGGAKPNPARDASIVMQHSQEIATRVLDILVRAEAIKLPAAAKRESFLLGKYEELTITAYNQAAQANVEAAVASLTKKYGDLDADGGDADDDFGDESKDGAKDAPESDDWDDDFDD